MNPNEMYPGAPEQPGTLPFGGLNDDTPLMEKGMTRTPYNIPLGVTQEELPGAIPVGDIASLYGEQKKPGRALKVLTGVIGSGHGGMSTYAVNLFCALPVNDYDVTFLSTVEHPYFEKQIKDHYGKIRVIPSRTRHPFQHKKELAKVFAEQKYDVCHIHLSTASNIEPIKAAIKAGVGVIIAHVHSAGAEGGKIARLLHKLNAPKLGKMPIIRLACSTEAGRFGYGGGSFAVVPNAIDLGRFYWEPGRRNRFRRYHDIPLDSFVIGNVGRFVSVKNQGYLLELLAELKKLRPDAKLLLCGDGPKLAEMKEKAASMGLEGDVFFPGNIVNPQDAYCAMDVMVLPSLFEGFPLTVAEGYACGLPCLVSDTVTREAGFDEHIAFFSLDGDKAELAKKALAMAIPEDERCSFHERLRELHFDWNSQSEEMQQRYRGGDETGSKTGS